MNVPSISMSFPELTEAVAPLSLLKICEHGVKTTVDDVVGTVGALVHKYNL